MKISIENDGSFVEDLGEAKEWNGIMGKYNLGEEKAFFGSSL